MSFAKSKLLYAGQLQKKGYTITLQKYACEIYKPTRVAIDPLSSKRLFLLKIKVFNVVKVKYPSWIWHFCNNPLYFGGLTTLQ